MDHGAKPRYPTSLRVRVGKRDPSFSKCALKSKPNHRTGRARLQSGQKSAAKRLPPCRRPERSPKPRAEPGGLIDRLSPRTATGLSRAKASGPSHSPTRYKVLTFNSILSLVNIHRTGVKYFRSVKRLPLRLLGSKLRIARRKQEQISKL